MRPGVIILITLLAAWLFGIGYCHNANCPNCQTVKSGVPAATAPSKTLSLKIADEDLNFTAAANDNLLFTKGTCTYNTPLSANLNSVFQQAAQHLANNSRRILVLTGLYEGGETNTCTEAADLGIARAEAVKQLLVDLGAPAAQIELEASEIADLDEYKEMKVGGVKYYFKEVETAAATEETLRAGNITLYFETNKQEINLNPDQKAYLENLKAYLAQNSNAKALVTGHTDNKGDDKWNMRLSRKRSEFVRDFMIEQGIPKRQIVNEGIGPDEPIATNATEEGRALNRRVEITLQ